MSMWFDTIDLGQKCVSYLYPYYSETFVLSLNLYKNNNFSNESRLISSPSSKYSMNRTFVVKSRFGEQF